MDTNTERQSVLLRIPRDRYDLIRRLAQEGYRSMNRQLIMLIDEALAARNVGANSAKTGTDGECKE